MMKLQPLRIPPGWEVVLNRFLEWDVEDWSVKNENWLDLTEDIAYFRRKGRRHEVGIDLGWYPDMDPQGAFHVRAMLDERWEKPMKEYVTRERKEAVKIIEDLLSRYCFEHNVDVDWERCAE